MGQLRPRTLERIALLLLTTTAGCSNGGTMVTGTFVDASPPPDAGPDSSFQACTTSANCPQPGEVCWFDESAGCAATGSCRFPIPIPGGCFGAQVCACAGGVVTLRCDEPALGLAPQPVVPGVTPPDCGDAGSADAAAD